MTVRLNTAGARSFGEHTGLPALGDIQYFRNPPSEPGWLKCDGNIHLRADYPEYAALRPHAAWRFRHEWVEPPTAYWPPSLITTASGKQFLIGMIPMPEVGPDVSRYAVLKYDPNTGDKEEVILPDSEAFFGLYSLVGTQFSSGKIVVLFPSSTDAWYSVDDGETWVKQSGALPEPMPEYYGELAHMFQNGQLVIPVPETSRVFSINDANSLSEPLGAWTYDVGAQIGGVLPSDNFAFKPPIWQTRLVVGGMSATIALAPPSAPFYSEILPGNVVFTSRNGQFSEGPLGAFTHSIVAPQPTERGWLSIYCQSPPWLLASGGWGYAVPIPLQTNLSRVETPAFKALGEHILFADYDFWIWDTPSSSMGFLQPGSTLIERMDVSVHPDLQVLGGSYQCDDIGYVRDQKLFIDGQARSVVILYDGSWDSMYYFETYLDPLYFHAPGLNPVAGAHPYVYTNATPVYEPGVYE